MDFQDLTDEQLVEHAQAGRQLAFTALADRYWARLLRYVCHLAPRLNDGEDVIQDALLKAYLNLRSFNPDRRFSPWIYRIVRNSLLDHVKAIKRDPVPFFDPEVLFPHPISPDRPDTATEIVRIREMLDAQVERLDPRYREPLILRYFQDLSYRDMAEVLHLPIGTVGIRVKRGLAQLRSLIPFLAS